MFSLVNNNFHLLYATVQVYSKVRASVLLERGEDILQQSNTREKRQGHVWASYSISSAVIVFTLTQSCTQSFQEVLPCDVLGLKLLERVDQALNYLLSNPASGEWADCLLVICLSPL